MNRIHIQNLALEITSKCNLECRKCINKKTNNIIMSNEIIEATFNQIYRINALHIYGGEPTLTLDTILNIFKTIVYNHIILEQVVVSINGSNYSYDFLRMLDYISLYMQCSNIKPDVKFNILRDRHHKKTMRELGIYKEALENVKKYMQSNYFNQFEKEPSIITKSSIYPDLYVTYMNKYKLYDQKNGICSIGPLITINPNGIITEAYPSIEEQEILYNYGNILFDSIEDVALKRAKIIKPISWYFETYKTIR